MPLDNTGYTGSGELRRWLSEVKRIHFLGIAGAGMRVLARMCAERGYTVTGSDLATDGEGALSLGLFGIVVEPPSGHSSIMDADMAVYSVAIREESEEIAVAKERGIPLVSRADLLSTLMEDYREKIGVAGTHGKSTTTAMLASCLSALGRRPTAVLGASLGPLGDGYLKGEREFFAFEACEYRRAFLLHAPTVAVVTNAEWDHPDCYPSREAYLRAFEEYLSLPSVRLSVLSAEDEGTCELMKRIECPCLSFGIAREADVMAADIRPDGAGSRFRLILRGEDAGEVSLPVPGRHNVLNALATAGAALALGEKGSLLAASLSRYRGILRRTEYRGRYRGVYYYDDYAHHPTEIRAALTALRGEGRLFCIYQPHTYTRTEEFFSDFAKALSLADCPIVVGTYAARETPISGADSAALAKAAGGLFLPTPEEASLYVRSLAESGDRVVVMGAGDVSARIFLGCLGFPEGEG